MCYNERATMAKHAVDSTTYPDPDFWIVRFKKGDGVFYLESHIEYYDDDPDSSYTCWEYQCESAHLFETRGQAFGRMNKLRKRWSGGSFGPENFTAAELVPVYLGQPEDMYTIEEYKAALEDKTQHVRRLQTALSRSMEIEWDMKAELHTAGQTIRQLRKERRALQNG